MFLYVVTEEKERLVSPAVVKSAYRCPPTDGFYGVIYMKPSETNSKMEPT